MKRVENGNFVKVCYTGKLQNGTIFDKTDKCKPLEVEIGTGGLVEGFESAIVGMELNEKKSFILDPEKAYGIRDERLERSFLRAELPLNFEPSPGQVIIFMTENGQQFPAMVKSVDQEVLEVDFNHPLAGKSLAFEVEIAEINTAHGESSSQCESRCCCA